MGEEQGSSVAESGGTASPKSEGPHSAGKSRLPPHDEFTVVFSGSLAKFDGNPFKTDTPFGRPVAVGIGNAFTEMEAMIDAEEGLEWFWRIVDASGLADVPSDERAALRMLVDRAKSSEEQPLSPSEASAGNPATDEPNTSTPPTQSEEP